jgi:type IV pilus assembly protein PilE
MHQRNSGFTLIELMVVVAVVAILAAIALPSFNEQMRKSRRAEAVAEMGQVQLGLERWRADNASYAISAGNGQHPLAAGTWTSDHYSFSFSGDGTGYTLTADGTGAQSGDRCGQLTATASQEPTWATASCN